MKTSVIKFLTVCIAASTFLNGCSSNVAVDKANLKYAEQHHLLSNSDYKKGAQIQCVSIESGFNSSRITANIVSNYIRYMSIECIHGQQSNSYDPGYYHTCMHNMRQEARIINNGGSYNASLTLHKVNVKAFDGYSYMPQDGKGRSLGIFAYQTTHNGNTVVYTINAAPLIINGIRQYMQETGECVPIK